MDSRARAVALRRIEIAILWAGMAIALATMAYLGRGAFDANLAWTKGGERTVAIVFTLFSFAVVGAVVVAPYVTLLALGRFIPADGRATTFQAGGIVIAAATIIASVYLSHVASAAISGRNASSTSAVVLVVTPVYVLLVSGAVYGVLLLIHARVSRRDRA